MPRLDQTVGSDSDYPSPIDAKEQALRTELAEARLETIAAEEQAQEARAKLAKVTAALDGCAEHYEEGEIVALYEHVLNAIEALEGEGE